MPLAENLQMIQQRIEAACTRSGRDPRDVLLLAVSKGQPPAVIRQAVDLGLLDFGESKVQEAKAKISLSPGKARWQMIGHLQSNKTRDAVHFFQAIQSVDSIDLARDIDKWADKHAKNMPVLLEVNLAGERSKFGFPPEAVLARLLEINALNRLEIHGLMTMAPWSPDPEKARPVFRQLRELKTRCEELLGAPLPLLSMGMSGDFEIAIEEGSTCVRIGTALFGGRASASKIK
jgi:PLP dependent protein